MGFEKLVVQDRCDPADDLTTLLGEEQADLCFFKEGMLAGKELALLEEKGWDPVGVASVDAVWQVEEGLKIALAGNRDDLHN
jgi:hypothetical protein